MKRDRVKEFKALLKKYNKVEAVDQDWIDKGKWVLDKIELLEAAINDKGIDGLVQSTKSGYTQKTGYVQTLDSMYGIWAKVTSELGLSPRSREKWIAPKAEKAKDPLLK